METKTQLLDSAERVARKRGFDGFSYADLASDVGIRKASIHHHFPTKADLALALVRRYRETFMATLGDISSRRSSSLSKLTAYVALYREALAGGKMVCLCVAFSVGTDSFDASVLKELNGFHLDSINWIAQALKAGQADGSISEAIKPSKEAPSILALMEGAQLMARAAGDASQFDKAVRTLTDRLKA